MRILTPIMSVETEDSFESSSRHSSNSSNGLQHDQPEVGVTVPEVTRCHKDAISTSNKAVEEWLIAKQRQLAALKQKHRQKERIEAEKLRKKREDCEKAYRAWKKAKDEVMIKRRKTALTREKQLSEKEHSKKKEQQEVAVKTFQHWKSAKDALMEKRLRAQMRKLRISEDRKLQKEQERQADAEKAFQFWYEQRKHVLLPKVEKERTPSPPRSPYRPERTSQSLKAYKRWLRSKLESSDTTTEESEQLSNNPWYPP